MRVRLAVLFWAVFLGCCQAADPSVTNVRASQRAGTGYVDIIYDLSDGGSDNELTVTVGVSTNGGAVYFTPVSGLSGDTGSGVAHGASKKIMWNAGAALSPDLYNNVRVKVTASDAPDGMVLIPAGTNSGTNPLGTGESYDSNWYPQTYSLTVEAFYMDATEVTKAQWDAVYTWAVAHGYSFSQAGSGKAANHPVHSVSWYDCVTWCNARSEKEGRTPCYNLSTWTCNFAANGYRLPTVTEWEYAARGGLSSRRFPWGDTITHSQANYYSYWDGSSPYFSYDAGYQGYDTRYTTGGYPYTSPVGVFAANGYGLYDMAGNLCEWCNDSSGSSRRIRGGCWDRNASYVRCGSSFWGSPVNVSSGIGFRAVCR